MIPTHIRDLARVIIACELSSQPEFRGFRSDDPRLLEMADRFMNDPHSRHRDKVTANDGIKMARAVHYYQQDKLRELVDIVWKECSKGKVAPSTDWAGRLIAKVWPDDTPQYKPRSGQ